MPFASLPTDPGYRALRARHGALHGALQRIYAATLEPDPTDPGARYLPSAASMPTHGRGRKRPRDADDEADAGAERFAHLSGFAGGADAGADEGPAPGYSGWRARPGMRRGGRPTAKWARKEKWTAKHGERDALALLRRLRAQHARSSGDGDAAGEAEEAEEVEEAGAAEAVTDFVNLVGSLFGNGPLGIEDDKEREQRMREEKAEREAVL